VTRALLLVVIALTGCAGNPILPPQPSAGFQLGEVLEEVDFSHDFDWENFRSARLKVDFRVEDGVYRAFAYDGGFVWTLNAHVYGDVLIQVDTLQLSDDRDNAYGVMCRAAPDDNGDGYYFFISADGHYTIRRGFNREVQPLIAWTPTAAVQQDRAPNRLRALCVGDRLALYVNGQFVAETRDDLYGSGGVGISAAVPEGGEVDVEFDNLIVWSASD
jgi:hypothetical protein